MPHSPKKTLMERLNESFTLDNKYGSANLNISTIGTTYYFSNGGSADSGLDNLDEYSTSRDHDPIFAEIEEITFDYKGLLAEAVASTSDSVTHAIDPYSGERIGTDSDPGESPEIFFLNALYKGLMTLDGVYDAGEALVLQTQGNPDGGGKPNEKALKNAAKKHGFTGLTAIEDYNAAVISESFRKLLDRTSAYGSLMMSAFKGMLYYFRPEINEMFNDSLTGETGVDTGRGRYMTRLESLMTNALTRREFAEGHDAGMFTSYMSEIIRKSVMGSGYDPPDE